MTTEAPPAAAAPAEKLLGKRIAAGLIDGVLMVLLFVVMAAIFGDSDASTDDGGGSFSLNLNGAPAIVYLLLAIGYYTVLEALTGQTLGKKIVGIKVVAVDGPMTYGKAFIRSILRVVDGLPFLIPYIVGIIAISSSKRQQRIGDMAAGTIVVSV